MKNLVTQGYIDWLEKFRLANATQSSLVKISTRLIASLQKTESIDTLNDLITNHITCSSDDSIKQYLPPVFYQQLSDWHNNLAKINGACDTGLAILQTLSPTPENVPLITLLTEILNDKRARMHIRITSILQTLSDKHFPDLLLYITTLAEQPYPTAPRKGDIAAIPPENEYHKKCLYLLNNLVCSPSSHPDWDAGNGLLQASLLVYLDMYQEEINLNEADDFIPDPGSPHSSEGSCNIL